MKLIADWQLQGPLLLLWPFRADVWRDQGQPAQQQLLQLIDVIVPHHPVWVGCIPEHFEQVREQVPESVPVIPIPYNDSWPRDIGPLWARANEQWFAHGFHFSAWHGLYPDFQADQAFAKRFARMLKIRFLSQQLTFEGGAISTDGQGSAVVHGSSVLRNNAPLPQHLIEAYLKQQLGLSQVFWLDWCNPYDETGGHTDNQVQFLDEHTVVVSLPTSTSPWFEAYQQQLLQVEQWRNHAGEPYRIITLPQPDAVAVDQQEFATVVARTGVMPRGEQPLLASYVNFISLPNMVVVPQFGLPTDAEAVALLQQAQPQKVVVGAAADEFIKAGGGLHCMSLHLPNAITIN